MNTEIEAAETVMKLTTDGIRIGLRLTGRSTVKTMKIIKGIFQSGMNSNGKVRINTLLREGKKLEVYELKSAHLKDFQIEAKRYAVKFTVVRKREMNPEDNVDIIVTKDDASRVDRILENLKRNEAARIEKAILGDDFVEIEDENDRYKDLLTINDIHNLYGSVSQRLNGKMNDRER